MSGSSVRSACLFGILALAIPALSARPQAEVREVRVKVVADEEWRRDAAWAEKAEAMLRSVSAAFERLCGVQLDPVTFGDWTSDDSVGSLEVLANGLEARADREGCDILVALTAQPNLRRGLSGYSLFEEGFVMVRAADDDAGLLRSLKHEIGHIFGAVHVPDPTSVMDPFLQGDEFDELNREALRIGRGRLFNTVEFPIPKPARPRAIELYGRISAAIDSAERQRKLGWTGATGVRAYVDETGRRETPEIDDAHRLLAQILVEEKRYDEAARTCRAALRLRPGDLEVQNLLGIIDRKQGRIDDAIRKYKAVLKEDPRHPRVDYNLGIALFKKGDFEAARAAYERAIELRPHSAEAHNNLGETLLRLGDATGAEREIDLAVSLDPHYILALANLADLALRRGDLAKARCLLEKAREADAGIPSVWNILGNLAAREGRPEEAEAHYRKALSLDPDFDKGYFNLGLCLFGMNKVDEASDNFLKAVGLNPNFAEAHASLGYCLVRDNRVDEGIAEILLARKLGFRSAVTCLNLSFAYIVKNRLDEAVEEARQAIALDPGLPMAHNNLGIAYTKKGQLAEAEAEFGKAVKADSRYRQAWLNLGNLYHLRGKDDRALESLVEAFKLDPKDGALANTIALLCFKKGDYRLALDYAEKAGAAGIAVDPGFLADIKKKLSGRDGT